MADKKAGIYFGKKGISLVETKGKAIIKQVRLSLAAGEGGADTLIANKERLRVAFQQFISDNRIDARRAFVGLLDKDQFIRSFPMMLLSKPEMDMGAQFESRKYIPLRPEDLVSDYQCHIDKKASKMDVLYVAAIKNNFENVFSALNQAGLEAAAVEPASLALLRVLFLLKQFELKASFLLVVMDDSDVELTVELMVISNGFPYLSREVKLSYSPDAEASGDENADLKTRLASEIRVSLDYYRRQFSGRAVDKVLFLSKTFLKQEELILGLGQDLALPVERVELEKDPEANNVQDLDMLKAYALALKDNVKLSLTIDLTKKKFVQPLTGETPKEIRQVALSVSVLKWPLLAALGLAILAFILPQAKINKANARLSQSRGELEGVLLPQFKGLTFEAWKSAKIDYDSKIETIEKLVKSRFTLTPSLNVLPGALEKGLWLQDIGMSVRDDGNLSLFIKGTVYLGERDAEVDAASAFYKALRSNHNFMRGLRNLELKSLNEIQMQVEKDKYTVTQFDISGS